MKLFITTLIIFCFTTSDIKAQELRRINFSINVNNVFTYPHVENYYGTNVGKIEARIGTGRQLEFRTNVRIADNYTAFTGISLLGYRTKTVFYYFKYYYPSTKPTLFHYPPDIVRHMLTEIPLGLSRSWHLTEQFSLSAELGMKLSVIEALDVPMGFEKISLLESGDSSHFCLLQDYYSNEPYTYFDKKKTLFYKYFSEINIYKKLKNQNLLGLGLNYTGAFYRKTKPQVEGYSYFYYYDKLSGKGYMRNSGSYLGIKISYVFGRAKSSHAPLFDKVQKTDELRRINFSLNLNNAFTYPHVENYYGTNVGKVEPRLGIGWQLEFRTNLRIADNYNAFMGFSLLRYKTITKHYYYYHPSIVNFNIFPFKTKSLLTEIPFGISKSWDLSEKYSLSAELGIKLSVIEHMISDFSVGKPIIANVGDTNHHLLYFQNLYTNNDSLFNKKKPLYFKYFGEINIYKELKNQNLLGFGLNYTAAFFRKTKPQAEGYSYFYYYDKLRGEGYIRNSGSYLGIKISYIFRLAKKKK
ncbi:MAG: hypothetical protein U9R42_08585 [Bacteroidota bacterium]|nr:hypothetical protein [Bacteroidota bacterium]